MRAIGEGITESPVPRVKHLRPARRANGRVGGDVGPCFTANAVRDLKGFEVYDIFEKPDFNGFDMRERWRIRLEAAQKSGNAIPFARGPDEDSLAVVPNTPNEIILFRQAPHGRSEANPLHRTADANLGRLLADRLRPA
jgi:hypothetical protein